VQKDHRWRKVMDGSYREWITRSVRSAPMRMSWEISACSDSFPLEALDLMVDPSRQSLAGRHPGGMLHRV